MDLLENIQKNLLPLKSKYPDFRWVPEKNLHITMAFLGETDAALIPKITEAIQDAEGTGIIPVIGERLFTLPQGRPANVLAMGFSKGGEKISLLSQKIMKNLQDHSIFPVGMDRKFTPHITLARKGRSNLKLDIDDLSFSAEGEIVSVGLFESRLSSHGADYYLLAGYRLDSRTGFR